jgi:hypothetical protein
MCLDGHYATQWVRFLRRMELSTKDVGMSLQQAHCFCAALNGVEGDGKEARVYTCFMRFDKSEVLTIQSFISSMAHGNAALFFANEGSGIGHFVCVWLDKDKLFCYDSVTTKTFEIAQSSKSRPAWLLNGKEKNRALYVFKFPTERSQKRVAVAAGLRNLHSSVKAILKHALQSSIADSLLPFIADDGNAIF